MTDYDPRVGITLTDAEDGLTLVSLTLTKDGAEGLISVLQRLCRSDGAGALAKHRTVTFLYQPAQIRDGRKRTKP